MSSAKGTFRRNASPLVVVVVNEDVGLVTRRAQFSAGKGQGRAQANAAVHGKKPLGGAKMKAVSNTTSICLI